MMQTYQAKRMRLYRKLNPPTEEQRRKEAERQKRYYAENRQRLLAYQKQQRDIRREDRKNGTTN